MREFRADRSAAAGGLGVQRGRGASPSVAHDLEGDRKRVPRSSSARWSVTPPTLLMLCGEAERFGVDRLDGRGEGTARAAPGHVALFLDDHHFVAERSGYRPPPRCRPPINHAICGMRRPTMRTGCPKMLPKLGRTSGKM